MEGSGARTGSWKLKFATASEAEMQRAAEAERTRIARDLHDELGAGLTEVSLLAGAGPGESREAEKQSRPFPGHCRQSPRARVGTGRDCLGD